MFPVPVSHSANMLMKAIASVDESHSYVNEQTIAQLNKICSRQELIDLLVVSVALRSPIAQFLVDLYTHCAWKYGWTINEFMDESPALSALPFDSKVRHLLRRHLSAYFEHVYEPLFLIKPDHDDDDDDSDDDDEMDYKKAIDVPAQSSNLGYETDETDEKRSCDGSDSSDSLRMSAMLQQINTIHSALRVDPINKFAQIDVMFLRESVQSVNAKYLESLGITYEELGKDGMYLMMKRFNQKLKGDGLGYGRCIMLIVGANDPSTATVFIYQPLTHSSVPSEIADCCEFAYISNTKSQFLPERTVENSNALCLSFHTHRNAPRSVVERVYLSDGVRNVRVFKSTLQDTLLLFGVEAEDKPCVAWEDRQFNDPDFHRFVDSLYSDLEMMNTNSH